MSKTIKFLLTIVLCIICSLYLSNISLAVELNTVSDSDSSTTSSDELTSDVSSKF